MKVKLSFNKKILFFIPDIFPDKKSQTYYLFWRMPGVKMNLNKKRSKRDFSFFLFYSFCQGGGDRIRTSGLSD